MLRYELIGSRALLTIDDAEHHNPMSDELMSDLAAAVVTAAGTDDVRAIVLTGAGDKAFSAGGSARRLHRRSGGYPHRSESACGTDPRTAWLP